MNGQQKHFETLLENLAIEAGLTPIIEYDDSNLGTVLLQDPKTSNFVVAAIFDFRPSGVTLKSRIPGTSNPAIQGIHVDYLRSADSGSKVVSFVKDLVRWGKQRKAALA